MKRGLDSYRNKNAKIPDGKRIFERGRGREKKKKNVHPANSNLAGEKRIILADPETELFRATC